MAKFENAINYIKISEGGLSRSKADSARKYPAPFTYKGYSDWHTNKGVTYRTFSSLAKRIGYDVNASNFFNMPNNIWLGIYKVGYWKPMQGDKINSQAMADAIVDYAWAFGVGGASKRIYEWLMSEYKIKVQSRSQMVQAINAITRYSDVKVFKKFIEHRKDAFIKLDQPKNIKGWLKRMDELYKHGIKYTYTKKLPDRQEKPDEESNKGLIAALLISSAFTFYNKDKIVKMITKS